MTTKSDFDYKKYLDLVSKRRYLFVVVALVIMTGITAVSYLLPEKYAAQCSVFIEKSVISDLVKGIAVTPTYDDKIRVLGYAIKSRTLLLRVFDDLDMNVGKLNDAQLEKTIKKFQDRTDIKLKDREGMFIISFYDENPRLARDYVNTLVRRYIEENVSSKKEESYDATRYLAEQLAAVKEKLDKAESRVNAFKKENGSYFTVKDYDLNREIDESRQRVDEISLKRAQLVAMKNQVSKNGAMQTRLSALHKKLEELSLVYTENYPEVIRVKNEIESVKETMNSSQSASDSPDAISPEAEKLSMEIKTLNQIEQNQRRMIASKQSLLRNIPAARNALDELEQERSTQMKLYNELMSRYDQSEVSKQMQLQDKATTFRIVDPAIIAVKPFSPNRVKIMLLGILAGLACSFAFLVLLDYFDDSIRTVDTVKSLGVPVLAVVQKIKNNEEIMLKRKRDQLFFTIAGAYFSLLLVTLSVELMKDYPSFIANPAMIKHNLSNLKNSLLK